MGVIDPESNQIYIEASAKLLKEMKFDDIELEKRYHEHTFKRDDDAIQNAYDKIKLCRTFLNKLP